MTSPRPDPHTDIGGWMRGNLSMQGYGISDGERRRLWLGLRFPTALCLALVVTALLLQSALLLAALVPIGAVAGRTARHPFDHVWNHALRRVLRTPGLPPNPMRRRHAFKLATVWLSLCSGLFAAGASTIALVLGGMLVAVCGLVTATNFCIPSLMLGWWDQRRRQEVLS
jgi:Domain of unknown function (DUF4395)